MTGPIISYSAPEALRRWLRLALNRLLIVLLVLEGFLLVSERFRWLSKGWPVLTAVAAAILVILFLLLWFVASLIHRWWIQLGIPALIIALGLLALGFVPLCMPDRWLHLAEEARWRALMALTAVGLAILSCVAAARFSRCRFRFTFRSLALLVMATAIPSVWMTLAAKKAQAENAAMEAVSLSFVFDYDLDQKGNVVGGRPTGPIWLSDMLGQSFFGEVVGGASFYVGVTTPHSRRVPPTDSDLDHIKTLSELRWLLLTCTQVTDAGLETLGGLRHLDSLDLAETEVSDDGLEYLVGMTQLRFLNIRGTRITDEGVKTLQRALPNCKIFWSPAPRTPR